jgi:hypothetical protein
MLSWALAHRTSSRNGLQSVPAELRSDRPAKGIRYTYSSLQTAASERSRNRRSLGVSEWRGRDDCWMA